MRDVLVIGMGKVGSLVATMLQELVGFRVLGVDVAARSDLVVPFQQADIGDAAVLSSLLAERWAVVSCLPYHLNWPVAQAAHKAGVHYFDLTEDVPTTQAILELSKGAGTVLAPQCGLAPGFIGIVGAHLMKRLTKIRSAELRVGALPQHPNGLLGYAFLWSPEGVVNEYLNDCEVIQSGERKMVPAMQDVETIVIDGVPLEAFTTSGGLGTMCETYLGEVEELNYKTMRYPGHCGLMRFFFHELRMKENRRNAGEILVHAKPPVNDDVVYIHASATGEKEGQLFREEFVRAYKPIQVAGQEWRAISWTTAASACAVIEMVSKEILPTQGFLKQEEIPLDAFLETSTGSLYGPAD